MTFGCKDRAIKWNLRLTTRGPSPSGSSVDKSSMSPDEQLPTRASLLERLKNLDDQASWTEFYQTYHELIYSVARRAGLTEHEAGEALQETLISVARKMPEFTYDPTKDSFKGWLLTVTRWRVRDQLQKRRNTGLQERLRSASSADDQSQRTATVDRVPDPAGFELAAIWDEEWEKHLLETALRRIKRQVHPQHYEIYHLHVVLDQPVQEVKKTLGVSAAQVYLAKHRVGSLLRRELKRLQNGICETK
jgi:RNA polymerase sigma factor (sigma-70 family)